MPEHSTSGPKAVLLMGPTAKEKFMNVRRNLAEGRVVTIQAVLTK